MKQTNNLVTKPFLRQELKKELKALENKFLESLDKVMGELKGIREDFDIFTGKYGEIHDQLENHESRIGNLERKATL